MSHATPRSACAFTVLVVLAAGACADKTPHRGWTAPFDAAAAEALVAKCSPGAKVQKSDAPRVRRWRLADPGPTGWLTFGITYDFQWEDDALGRLGNVAIGATGPADQQTPDNSARYRAALVCAFATLPMPPKVGAKSLDLLAAIRPPGKLTGKRDGFDIVTSTGSHSSDSFYSTVHIFGE